MKQKIQKILSDLFYKSRNNRIYQARKVGYRNILKMHYDPELTVDGETGYFNLWKQLTNKISHIVTDSFLILWEKFPILYLIILERKFYPII